MEILNLTFIIVLSYLVGSIPTGIIVGKLVKGVDIREYGSGSMGATNVFRTLGWQYGLLVIVFDALKGALAVLFIARMQIVPIPFNNATPFDDLTILQIIAGLAAVLGHIWTVFAGFKGGKGIATALGFLLTLITVDMLVAFAIFLIVVVISKYISLGSIIAAISIPVIMVVRENVFGVHMQGYTTILPFIIALALLVIYTHRTNISRLVQGTENRFSFKKKKIIN